MRRSWEHRLFLSAYPFIFIGSTAAVELELRSRRMFERYTEEARRVIFFAR